jgi:hypothetical protein
VYQLYHNIVLTLEQLSRNLRDQPFATVKAAAEVFVEAVEADPNYGNLTAHTHQLLHLIRTATTPEALRYSLGSGIHDGILNKSLFLKPHLRRSMVRNQPIGPAQAVRLPPIPRSHAARSLPGARSPSFRINIEATPERTAQLPQPVFQGPAQTPELQQMEAGELQEPEERKNLDPELRYRGRHEPLPIPDSPRPGPIPRQILEAGGNEVVRRIRGHVPGRRFIPQEVITYGGPVVLGALLNYGYNAAVDLANYLTTHPEVQQAATETKHATHRQGFHHTESSVDFAASLKPGPHHKKERPKVNRRYTGNYEFPLGAYNYVDYEKFTRNNTLKSLA